MTASLWLLPCWRRDNSACHGMQFETHAEALRMMRYYVKTVHGISEDCYKGTERNETFIRAVLLFTEFNSPPNLVRDKGT